MDDHPNRMAVPMIARPIGISSGCRGIAKRSADRLLRRLRNVIVASALFGGRRGLVGLLAALVLAQLGGGRRGLFLLAGLAVLRQPFHFGRELGLLLHDLLGELLDRAVAQGGELFDAHRIQINLGHVYLLSLYFGCGMIREKPGPHVDRGVDTGFPWANKRKAFARRSCSNNKLERDDDSS